MLLRPKGRHEAGPGLDSVGTIYETTYVLSTTFVTVTAPTPTTTIVFLPLLPSASSDVAGPSTLTSAAKSQLASTNIRTSSSGAASAPTASTSSSSSSSVVPGSSGGFIGNGNATPLETAAPAGTTQTKNFDRKAVVGGLSGTIAGLLLIGLLLFFCLRRRRKSRELREISEPVSEKGMPSTISAAVAKPGLARQISNFALGHLRNRSTPELPRPRRPSPCDGSLIRVPVDHWDRPFAAGGGLRDSITPVPLRVANPDPSRASTPQPAARPNLLRKQSSKLVAFLQERTRGTASVPVPDSDLLTPLGPQIRHIEPALSREWLVHDTRSALPSSPSQATLPVIVQHPPDDPFIDALRYERPTVAHHSTPTLPMADWTIAHNPFQPHTPQVPWIGLPIYTTYSSSALGVDDTQRSLRSTKDSLVHVAPSTTSDQFDLAISPSGSEHDEQYRRSMQHLDLPGATHSVAPSPNYRVYEGT